MSSGVYCKEELKAYVLDRISGKIKTLDFYRGFTLEASLDLKKTSKYDSFREEMQEEIYHLDRQMHALKTMQRKMRAVVVSRAEVVQLGALVLTNKARFYLSVSFGEFFFEGERFYAISLESPMGKVLAGKRPGDEFVLNGIYQKIVAVY
ncbi:hypothetical protein [Bergeyella sp. RCAD1439]|uniref:hypothetical protein n=1 Tax=Bergeyella anatis TaxID=3113737 RepID=UPI002E19C9D9|nr:hypothetical protein [Bergeyella sp. RCAD1439]